MGHFRSALDCDFASFGDVAFQSSDDQNFHLNFRSLNAALSQLKYSILWSGGRIVFSSISRRRGFSWRAIEVDAIA